MSRRWPGPRAAFRPAAGHRVGDRAIGSCLLQSRPITSLRAMADPDGGLTIWDNSNIAESYSGVTTPLTFSFARGDLREVYRQFCRMMGVPERVIAGQRGDLPEHARPGSRPGLLQPLNWYRVLALLPGFQVNRRFMEQMMGVKEALPDALAGEIAAIEREAARSTRCTAIAHGWRPRRESPDAQSPDRRLLRPARRALAPPAPPLDDRRLDELVAHYRDLERRLLLSWDAPLVNDFFAMIFYGVLRSLVDAVVRRPRGHAAERSARRRRGHRQRGAGRRMQRLAPASPAARRADRCGCSRHGRRDPGRARPAHPEFVAQYNEYLAKFGDRYLNELKLESATLHDDPLPLFRAVGRSRSSLPRPAGPTCPRRPVRRPIGSAIESKRRVRETLAAHPLRRLIFGWVLAARRAASAIARTCASSAPGFSAASAASSSRSAGGSTRSDLLDDAARRLLSRGRRGAGVRRGPRHDDRPAAAWRRCASASSRLRATAPPPDDRFETRGPVYHGHDFRRAARAPAAESGRRAARPRLLARHRSRTGARRDRSARRRIAEPRAILVAEHTDPGWIMVFPAARGLLVERGSLLSHAAIVARELGIPAIVSLPGRHALAAGR